ncbi:ABC transporter ATP-binding protein [Pseudaquabacterium pictum]|uniref:Cyclolysin secretion/processing ATP-binding protein CyaB n=1 Tax=Pseudaquabacterium pictum TaxID=2315236 RepID=A0A480ARC7_9BURK|nr:ABC transporter ATP-binding protein [Rubrivivax pictus]GCL63486.1 ABC transporter ATP-binding protein [Rubrivivax pictus]
MAAASGPHPARSILALFTAGERRQALRLLGMVIAMALLDMLGVASIMPFMAMLADPGAAQTSAVLRFLQGGPGMADPQTFLLFLGGLVFSAVCLSIAFKAYTTRRLLHFTHGCSHALGQRLLASYLARDYTWFLQQRASDLGKTILSEVDQVLNGVIIPAMNLVTHGAVAVALLGLLIAKDPLLASYVGLGCALAYGLIYAASRGLLHRLGQQRAQANQIRFALLQEIFGGMKEVKAGGHEAGFLQRFGAASDQYARAQAKAQAAAQLPRFLIEVVAFGGMLLVFFYLTQRNQGVQGALPAIALYAFAAFRLIPAVQNIYGSLSRMKFGNTALNHLLDHLAQPAAAPAAAVGPPPGFLQGAALRQVRYTYPGRDTPALQDIDLVIPAGASIGLVGRTGSGKSTTLDLVLGLLPPDSGALCVDGQRLQAGHLRAWQALIGYVPQRIHLSDDTVAANIAFGLPVDRIDRREVERCARLAEAHGFITSELPQGYDTPVGEHGLRLSGGQRQRLGIARALYRNPRLLVLDEATSALDSVTERNIMQGLHQLQTGMAVLVISHRLTALRACQCIHVFERGRITASGNFDQLAAGSAEFRRMLEGSAT